MTQPTRPRLPQDRVQQMVDSLPPVDLGRFTFTVTRFAHFPDDMAPTAWQITVEVLDTVTHADKTWNTMLPLSSAEQVAAANNVRAGAVTMKMILDWLWTQPQTQLQARQMQQQFLDQLAVVQARGGRPVPLPANDNVLGRDYTPPSVA